MGSDGSKERTGPQAHAPSALCVNPARQRTEPPATAGIGGPKEPTCGAPAPTNQWVVRLEARAGSSLRPLGQGRRKGAEPALGVPPPPSASGSCYDPGKAVTKDTYGIDLRLFAQCFTQLEKCNCPYQRTWERELVRRPHTPSAPLGEKEPRGLASFLPVRSFNWHLQCPAGSRNHLHTIAC